MTSARLCGGGGGRAEPSAVTVGMRLFHQADVGEGEVASFTFALALPLAVHVDLGHFNQVAHLSRTQKQPSAGRSDTPTPQRGRASAQGHGRSDVVPLLVVCGRRIS